jgi:hypothetical protein
MKTKSTGFIGGDRVTNIFIQAYRDQNVFYHKLK